MNISLKDKLPLTGEGVGLSFEDVNYAYDGGLYAELLENANFEACDVQGTLKEYQSKNDGAFAWSATGSDAILKIKTDRPAFAENPHYLRLTVRKAGEGIKNHAYGGIFCPKGTKYRLSFYVRSYDYRGKLEVRIANDGAVAFAKKFACRADGKWHKYEVRFKSKCDLEGGVFTLSMTGVGAVHLDYFSLMPENAIKKVFRRDLAELLHDFKPGIVRFPVGCSVRESDCVRWKKTIVERERRSYHANGWALYGGTPENGYHTPYSHYGQSAGIGCFECFLLSEYLGAKPVPVLGASIFRNDEPDVPTEGEDFDSCVQDMLDLISFACDPVDTEWGRVRAGLGHPRPFALEYFALGAQWRNNADQVVSLCKRVHDVYSDIKIISPSQEPLDGVYAVDEQLFLTPRQLFERADRLEGLQTQTSIGAYAADTDAWEGALAEAALLTAMERNADKICMSAYAPLFGRHGYTQFGRALIRFNSESVQPTANYYVQQLFRLYTGNVILQTSADEGDVYCSATEREGLIFVKLVNVSDEERTVTFAEAFGELTRIVCMSADLTADGTTGDILPLDVAPTAPDRVTVKANSFSVLTFRKK